MIYQNQTQKETVMKNSEMAKKGTYAGTGTGLIMFMLLGFFPGALIGGAVGLQLSKLVMGGAVEASIIPRAITAISMVAGILGSAAVFIVGFSVVGWAIGTAVEVVKRTRVSDMETAKESASN